MSVLDKKTKAIIQMLVCASMWSIAGIFIKLIPWNPFLIAGARSFVAGAALLVYVRLKKLPILINHRTVLSGVLLCCTYLCFVGANKLTTAANAIVLQFTSPVFILIFSSLIFKRRFSRADVAAVLLTLAGISLFFLDQLSPGHLLGNFVGIASGAFMAGMTIAMGEADMTGRISGILISQALTALAGLPFAAFTAPELSFTAVGSILVLGVLQLGVPYILFAKALEHCPPLACSLLGAMEPLLNPVWVFLFNGEAPGKFALIGGAAVIITISVWCVHGSRKGVEV